MAFDRTSPVGIKPLVFLDDISCSAFAVANQNVLDIGSTGWSAISEVSDSMSTEKIDAASTNNWSWNNLIDEWSAAIGVAECAVVGVAASENWSNCDTDS